MLIQCGGSKVLLKDYLGNRLDIRELSGVFYNALNLYECTYDRCPGMLSILMAGGGALAYSEMLWLKQRIDFYTKELRAECYLHCYDRHIRRPRFCRDSSDADFARLANPSIDCNGWTEESECLFAAIMQFRDFLSEAIRTGCSVYVYGFTETAYNE